MAEDGKPTSDPPKDESGDAGTAAATQAGEAGTGAAEDSTGTKVLTLTQEQLDAIIERRLAKAKDPATEEAARQWRAHEASQQSEAERLKAQQAAVDAAAEAKIKAADQRLKSADIRLEAARQGVRPEALDLVVDRLLASEEIEVDDKGDVKGTATAVTALVKSHDYLKTPKGETPPPKSGGEFGGTDGQTIDGKIAELEAKGDRASLQEARRLKMQKYESGIKK